MLSDAVSEGGSAPFVTKTSMGSYSGIPLDDLESLPFWEVQNVLVKGLAIFIRIITIKFF